MFLRNGRKPEAQKILGLTVSLSETFFFTKLFVENCKIWGRKSLIFGGLRSKIDILSTRIISSVRNLQLSLGKLQLPTPSPTFV